MGAIRTHQGWVDGPSAAWCDTLVAAARSPAAIRLVLGLIVLLLVFGSELLGTPHPRLDLDRERTAGAALTAGLLGTGAAAALLLSAQPRGWARLAGAVLGMILAFMATDELLALHERLQGLGGQGWMTWYAPVPVIAIAAGGVLAVRMDARARQYLLLGVAGWLVAGFIEYFLWGPGPLFQDPVTMPIEEVAEMLAAMAIAAGLLRGAAHAREDPTGRRPTRRGAPGGLRSSRAPLSGSRRSAPRPPA